ncbi:MAG: hypothetical protein WAN34_13310 [Acidimicrobiia bacterium]
MSRSLGRLLLRAVATAAVAAVALSQLQSESELLVWEILLLVVVVMEMRSIPSVGEGGDKPLLPTSALTTNRLPRSVASLELMVIDATGGHLAPERRLQPVLSLIAAHRLSRMGIDPASPDRARVLGERQWVWLATPTSDPVDLGLLEEVVSSLEAL